MKKTFFPLNFFFIFIYLVVGSYGSCGLCAMILSISSIPTHFDSFTSDFWRTIARMTLIIIAGLGTALIAFWYIIELMQNKIIFKGEKIIVTGHGIKKKQGLQFPDEIEYTQIQDVAIICANANSKKKRIKNAGYSSLRPYTYYEITLKNGDTKWMYIEGFSKRQREKMLDIINEKVGLSLSYNQLERKDYSIFRRKKRK